ncbi:MAG: NAD(+) synthase [Candidatus Heimdallarchaeota archaeon]|nr:MAG: NAD(+) synthase [Candidatus Heimdallarchaeota archaeon]
MTSFNLEINPPEVKKIITSSLKKTISKREANGSLVIFSGQLDSFTSAKLSLEAVGLESTKLIVISDVSKSRRKEIAAIASRVLGIHKKNIISFNINKISKQFDSVEGLIPEIETSVPIARQHNINHLLLRTDFVRKIMEEKTYTHVGKSESEREKFFQRIIAQSKVRKRLKILLAYLIAERENLLLVSKTNKTEYLAGLFTSFGYGHASDVMPLGDLYRTQVLQLAEHLEVPKEICDLAYTDILPGVQNKYQYFFELESSDVDQILVRLVAGLELNQIAKDLNLSQEKVDRVDHFYQVSKFQRHIPVIPKLSD